MEVIKWYSIQADSLESVCSIDFYLPGNLYGILMDYS